MKFKTSVCIKSSKQLTKIEDELGNKGGKNMKNIGQELKNILTAISYMLPLVVASGLLIAIGNLMGGEVVTDM